MVAGEKGRVVKFRSRLMLGCAVCVAGALAPLVRGDSINASLTGVLDVTSGNYTTTDIKLGTTSYNNVIAGAELWKYNSGTQVAQGTNFQTYCIEILQDVPDEFKGRSDTKGEASMRGHLSAEGAEQTGSQA